MGTIIEFPRDAASRKSASSIDGASATGMGIVLILPVVRIERETDGKKKRGKKPERGAASGGRRRRR